ncbi:MAG: trimeric intracellular cation channel family protein [Bacteroidota bacterium]
MIYALDLIGTMVFAISGALTAKQKQFDIFGAVVIAFVTAVGGGTIRDVLIGSTPVGWMKDLNYLYVILLGVTISLFFRKVVQKLRRTLFLFDTIGIGLFTILGLQKTLDHGIAPIVAVMMGAVSAVFGGVVRDTLCNEIPLIFRKEIYATACIAGGILYLFLQKSSLSADWTVALTVVFTILLRGLAVRYKWTLPSF